SRVRAPVDGARVGSLAEALVTDEAAVRAPLEALAAADPGAFAALNAALWEDGVLVRVPVGVALSAPLHLLVVATAPRGARPLTRVARGRGSRATVLESYVAVGGGAHLTNAWTAVALGAGAALEHVKLMDEGAGGVHVGRIDVHQEADSRLTSCSLAFGGRLVRNEISVRLDGERAECMLAGLAVQAGRQHVDTHTVVAHRRPRALSRQLFKGVLDGRARGVFSGRVVVERGADGTDAFQTNKNLLLADGVEVDSKPQLEIFADDVKCSHGAADGQLADDAIFYLK